MYFLDENSKNFNGKPVTSWQDLETKNVTFLEGNSKLLDDFLKNSKGIDNPQIAFLGDQYTSDVHWSHTNTHWHGIAVIEELTMVGDHYQKIES